MAATQATIDQWTSTPTDPFGFDEYGATMDRPLPTVEVGRQWRRQLRDRGFCPDSLAEAERIGHGHVMHGFHPADEAPRELTGSWAEAFERCEEVR
jgi:hypothetical protein